MSIPIAFAFDFTRVMTRTSTGFVHGNFARTGAAPLTGDAQFDNLDFDSIYHDAGIGDPARRAEIHNWRMSEIVVRNELPLAHYLNYIICRTLYEERTLRHLLGNQAIPPLIVEQRGAVFMRRGIFVDEIYFKDAILHVRFHHPTVHSKEKYKLKVARTDNGVRREHTYELEPMTWRFPGFSASDTAIWRIEIEDCVAFEGPVASVAGLVSA